MDRLSDLSLSTYRLLDPRRRSADHVRAYVGRILPQTLSASNPVQFLGEDAGPGGDSTPSEQWPDPPPAGSTMNPPSGKFGTPVNFSSGDDFEVIGDNDAVELFGTIRPRSFGGGGRLEERSVAGVDIGSSLDDSDLLAQTRWVRWMGRYRWHFRVLRRGLMVCGVLLIVAVLTRRVVDQTAEKPKIEMVHRAERSFDLPEQANGSTVTTNGPVVVEPAGGGTTLRAVQTSKPQIVRSQTVRSQTVRSQAGEPEATQAELEDALEVAKRWFVAAAAWCNERGRWQWADKSDASMAALPAGVAKDSNVNSPTEPKAVGYLPDPFGLPESRSASQPAQSVLSDSATPRPATIRPATIRPATIRPATVQPASARPASVPPSDDGWDRLQTRRDAVRWIDRWSAGTLDRDPVIRQFAAEQTVAAMWWTEEATSVISTMESYFAADQVAERMQATFARAVQAAMLPEVQRHLISHTETLALKYHRAGLHRQWSEVCSELQGFAADLRLPGEVDRLQQSLETARRFDRLQSRSGSSPQTIASGDARSARYWAIVRGHWRESMPVLVHASDRRLAAAAMAEVALDESSTPQQRQSVADRWLGIADRTSDPFEAESIRRHAESLTAASR